METTETELSKIKNIFWDYLIIGTSPISVLEALRLHSQGKQVLLIDKEPEVGGAWKLLNIFGFDEVENAIHYFMNDKEGIQFINRNLKWSVITPKKKYRVFHKNYLGIKKIAYDNIFGRFLSCMIYENKNHNIFKRFFFALFKVIKNPFNKSYYLQYGSKEIIKNIKSIVERNKMNIVLNCKINEIYITDQGCKIEFALESSNKDIHTVNSNKLIITHGTRLERVKKKERVYYIDNKSFYRPSSHIIINDSYTENFHELVYLGDPIIKYVHDVTRFIKNYDSVTKGKKILIVAFQNNINFHEEIYNKVLKILKKDKLISSEAKIENTLWSDIFLPSLTDNDLREIKNFADNKVDFLITESITKGIGIKSREWQNIGDLV